MRTKVFYLFKMLMPAILSILFLIGCSSGLDSVTPQDDVIESVDLTGRWQMNSYKLSSEAKIDGNYSDQGKGTVDDVIEFKSGNILNDPNDVFISGISKWNYTQKGDEIAISNGSEISYFKVTKNGKELKLEMNTTLAKKSLKESKSFNNILYLEPTDEIIKFDYTIDFIVAPIVVVDDPKVAPTLTRSITGEWVGSNEGAGGTGNFESFKNFQYNFEVSGNNQKVDIALKSPDINVQFVVFDPLGQRLLTSLIGRSVANTYTLNAGRYRLVICAARRAVGKFEFTINGVQANPTKIASQVLQTGVLSWGDLGGGGLDKSYKNHFHTFEVIEDNSSIDIELFSPDTEVALYLYDALGQRTVYEFANRYEYKTIAVKKGVYTLMAATYKRGNIGNYQANIFGKIRNLQKIPSQVTTLTGNWANKDAVHTYTLQINSTNNSPLDIELSSADVEVNLALQTGVGDNIKFIGSGKTEFIVSNELPKGMYRIEVKPYLKRGSGNYKLSVHGLFTDLKRL